MDVVLDSGGLSAWSRRRPPAALLQLLDVAARTGGHVVVPTVVVVESTTGRPREDAAANHRLARAALDDCTLDRARAAAALRFASRRDTSAVDAVVAATALARREAAVATSDPLDLSALVSGAPRRVSVVKV